MREAQDDLDDLNQKGLLRELRILSGPQQAEIEIAQESLLNFSSNDYLGLANHPDLKAAYREAIEKHGVGSGSSRLISGTMQPHIELEQQIAAIKQAQSALTFSTGYATATGSIPAIVGKNDYIILDKLCHASLIDGSRLSGATMRIFPHNDLTKLKSHLQWATDRSDQDSRILVITESVFSMDGDLAPLTEICELKQQYQALLMVDEAHALGVIGPEGRGLAAELKVESGIDFQMGTFSKAIGLSGGYLCASQDWIDLLINRARSFIFSTAPAPALAQTIGTALTLATGKTGDQLRQKLYQHIELLKPGASSPIVPFIIGGNEAALAASQAMRDAGFLIPAIRYPTVPRGTARLRVTLSAGHQKKEVEKLTTLLKALPVSNAEMNQA